MMQEIRQLGAKITERHPGVYQICGLALFPTQLVVTGELKPDLHATLRVLSNKVTKDDIAAFLKIMDQPITKGDLARMDAILQVSTSANKEIYQQIYKEESGMCQALREIMKEDFDKAEARGEARGVAIGEARGLEKVQTRWESS